MILNLTEAQISPIYLFQFIIKKQMIELALYSQFSAAV
jgi:hypothetical protein